MLLIWTLVAFSFGTLPEVQAAHQAKRSGAHQGPKSGAHQAPKSGAFQYKKSGAHQVKKVRPPKHAKKKVPVKDKILKDAF